MKWFIFMIVLILLMPFVLAKENTMVILAVADASNGTYVGSIATLSLDLQPGTGRVFIDLQPASKLDTQFSTKFAKRMACSYLDVDCSKYDFLYTIQANSAIIGGPSASAAVTLLTMASLLDEKYDNKISITGNINSGYLISRVGGVKAKIDAAKTAGLEKIMIPFGERFYKENNLTIDLYGYGEKIGIEVIEVSTIDDAIVEFFGKELKDNGKDLVIDPEYVKVMKNLSDILCNRSIKLKKILGEAENFTDLQQKNFDLAQNLTLQGENADSQSAYYARASYCYGANVYYTSTFLSLRDDNSDIIQDTLNRLSGLNKIIENKTINTINDLQAYMVIKDRITEGTEFLKVVIENKSDASKNNLLFNLASAAERFNSAAAWSEFFDQGGKKYDIKENNLRESCVNKLSEVEENFQYLQLFFNSNLGSTREDLNNAHADFKNKDYELCLYKASLVKAEINLILSSMGAKEEDLEEIFQKKSQAAKRLIVKQQEKGNFPILGYSYYEYASSLWPTEKYAAFIYIEYALELSNLDIYFDNEQEIRVNNVFDENLLILLMGIVVGILLVLTVNLRFYNRRRRFKRLVKKR